MAVITRYIIVRNGVELDKVFEIKKEAEAYDKMLDAAESLAGFIKQSDLDINIDDETIDALSIYLAKNGPDVTRILKGVKPFKSAPAQPEAKDEKPAAPAPSKEKKAPAKKSKAKSKRK